MRSIGWALVAAIAAVYNPWYAISVICLWVAWYFYVVWVREGGAW